ncbi:MAG: hypothetical protein E7628_01160 [Ruminococcaceae bacterium]|nr:hypothetical protein [Oscillospiraceae bacterium]
MTESIVKIAGSVILLATSIYFGQVKITAERTRIKILSSFGDMIKYIGEKIEHFSSPLPEILSEYNNPYLESVGYLDAIRSHGLSLVPDCLKISQNHEEYILIKRFTDSIGKGYKDEEVTLCKYTHQKLAELEEKMSAVLKDKEKLYRTIPPMLALSVILILI